MGSTALPSTMHAWRKHKGNPNPIWEELPLPSTPATGFLVKLLASGVCHSDQPLLDIEDRPQFDEKYTLGHEGCGEIIQIGEGVTDKRFKLGDRVALIAVPGCGLDTCSECSRDLAQLCPAGMHHGIGQDGFYAEYVAVDVRAAIPLPDGVEPAVAAVATDAVTTAYHGITRRAEVKKEETTFLFGLGGLGFNALQIVRTIGARVIVSDLRQEKLDAALKLGVPAEDIVPVGKSVQDFVKENGLQGKIDTVLEFVGSNQTNQDAQQIVRPGGKILCVGTLDLINGLDMKIGIRKRLSIIFTYGGQYRDLVEVLDLIAKGVIQPQVELGKLQDFPRVLKELGEGKIKDRIALVSDLV
ncbi:Alcohol dehydrogenase superfamily, zinc-containing [Penicillium camemberti]|uniref:Alcohol dehydrogenase superfamily, zinc-containing n=1 Tax=Penicillium camemberti (strain FM 013) TaxID=1429867 RepID=A0A0G4PP49_PENC3|nr:Alcohol dehydrogenase superfamily, zinc-containing [Penicillium camemberti]